MQSLTYVEIDIAFCSLTYSVAPCTASLGVTGDIKCFNSKNTCQDTANFTPGDVTLRFAKPADYLPHEIDCIPSILEVSYTPATISLGKDLGTRATLQVTFKDHPHSDTGDGYDKYLSTRTYDPYSQGTYWGKFRARQPFLRGQEIRWVTGLVGDALADMETRYFLIDSFDGPTPDGKYTIIAKDVLKLADGDRSQAPAMSEGFLVSDITSSQTTLTLSPSSIGSTYPATGYLNVGGNEVVSFGHDLTAGNDADCILLLHMDGTDASTTFTDSSSAARTMTANGNAQIDTADFVFGTASGLFDGTGDFVSTPDNAAFTFAGDFALECRPKFTSLAAARTLLCHSTDINNMYRLYVTTAGALQFDVVSASVTIITVASATGLIVTGTRYHVAVTRSGNNFRLFIDGALVATAVDADAIPNFTSTFKIGISGNGSSDAMLGWIDEVRVSKVARWTAAFTVPAWSYSSSVDSVDIVRAQLNTVAAAHKAQDRCQLVLSYVGEDPADIISDLLETYAGVAASYITVADWQAETAAYLGTVYTAHICEPTSVATLISELVEQAALAIWDDNVAQQVRLRVLHGVVTDAFTFTPENYLEKSLSIKEQPTTRLSRVQTYFGQIDPTKPLNNLDNYRSTSLVTDATAEIDYGSAAIKTITSRWIPQAGRTVADRLGAVLLGRFRDPPRHVSFSAARYAETDIELGQGYKIENFCVQDETGAQDQIPIQVTRLNPGPEKFAAEAEEMLWTAPAADLTDRQIIFDANNFNINLRTAHDSIYPTPQSGDVITATINTGVIIGSTSAASPAFDIGSWPAGVTLNLIVNGRIQGKGGVGGGGSYGAGSPGQTGGKALYSRYAFNLSVAAGAIFGGGGGGGGGGGTTFTPGADGGGGAGQDPGLGATATFPGSNGTKDAGGAGGTAPAGGAGGAGGGPGLSGSSGGAASFAGGVGGSAGSAIDGVSYRTLTTGPGDIRGGQIN